MTYNPDTGQLEGEIEGIEKGTAERIINKIIWAGSELAPKDNENNKH